MPPRTCRGNHAVLDPDPHEGEARLDYYIWLCRNGDRTVLVDTGFAPEEGAARQRILLTHPVEALKRIGVEPEDVTDVFITHLHYDHAGNLRHFPNATIHLQDAEMAYATGRCMCHARMRKPFAVEDVKTAVEMVYRDRVRFHEGDYTLLPGLTARLVGGHSQGLQILVVDGETPLVIASDALHLRPLPDRRPDLSGLRRLFPHGRGLPRAARTDRGRLRDPARPRPRRRHALPPRPARLGRRRRHPQGEVRGIALACDF